MMVLTPQTVIFMEEPCHGYSVVFCMVVPDSIDPWQLESQGCARWVMAYPRPGSSCDPSFAKFQIGSRSSEKMCGWWYVCWSAEVFWLQARLESMGDIFEPNLIIDMGVSIFLKYPLPHPFPEDFPWYPIQVLGYPHDFGIPHTPIWSAIS